LITDPVVSAVAGDGHKNNETRRSLQPLVDLLMAHRCAGLGISHFSKGTAGRDPVERVTGSVAFGAVPRVVFAAAKRREEDGGGRIFVRAKSNIGPDSGGFVYHLEQVPLPGYPEIPASRVTWGEALEGRASELLATAEAPAAVESQEEQAGNQDAVVWLKRLFEDRPEIDSREVRQAARDAAIPDSTLYRARVKLGVTIEPAGFGKDRHSTWRRSERVFHDSHPHHDSHDSQPLKMGNMGNMEGMDSPDAPAATERETF
jgi:putative DNA primase/helicase